MNKEQYDVLIVGGGHAGIEAAHAAACLGAKTALVTISVATIGQMSCNPAIGGLAKGQIVREIDALGGLMAIAADQAGIQFRMLNRSKGPAVWAPRAQADRWLYQDVMRDLLGQIEGLTIIEELVDGLIVTGNTITGLLCQSGRVLLGKAVVLTTGTFLRGLMHTGTKQWPGGRINEPAAQKLSQSLQEEGLELQRLKTGTPPRIDVESMDIDALSCQCGDTEPIPFSFLNDSIKQQQICCWITYTNEATHKIITDNLDRAPLYTGQIQSTGPRYCPSIETKIVRFADKSRHQVFLEPEGLNSNWIYCNGISTSLPHDAQDAMVHSIDGLGKATILQYGYAIEYDYIPPLQMRATLETKRIGSLFLAGQICGTSGYEEAAGQGLLAGVNAANTSKSMPLVTLRRDQSYIGVMIDDLVTKGVDEPYRMFTSRAEHRLLLRSDNADQRLTPIGRQWQLVDDNRWELFQKKQRQVKQIKSYIENRRIDGKPLSQLLRQQSRDEQWLLDADSELAAKGFATPALQQVVNDVRYAGYVKKQERLIERFANAENIKLPDDFDYHTISQLRFEAQEKLNVVQPLTLGQASRISGINPADITVLMIEISRRENKKW